MAERLSEAELVEIEAFYAATQRAFTALVRRLGGAKSPGLDTGPVDYLLAEIRALKADLAHAEKRAEQAAAQTYCSICGRVLDGDEVSSRRPVRPYIIDPLAHP